MRQATNESAIEPNEIIADIHYGSLVVIRIEQFPSITIEALFGNIGGLLGLWVCHTTVFIV